MAHIRQSRPDSGRDFKAKVLKTFRVVPSSLEKMIGFVKPVAAAYVLRTNGKRFRGGLVFKAHTLVYHSTLGSRVMKKKKEFFASATRSTL